MKKIIIALIFSNAISSFGQEGIMKKEADDKGNTTFVEFDVKTSTWKSNQAKDVLRTLHGMNTADDFQILKSEQDKLGYLHETYQQYYKGVKVQFGEYKIHSKNGVIEIANGNFHKVGNPTIKESIDEKSALSKALAYVRAKIYKWQIPEEEKYLQTLNQNTLASYYPKAELIIIENIFKKDNSFRLAYKFDIYAHQPISRAYIYVDANTGEILYHDSIIKHTDSQGSADTRYSGNQTITTDSFGSVFRLREIGRGSGIQTLNMQRGTNYGNAVDFTDNNNNWTGVEFHNANFDDAALDAHWGAEKTYDYFNNILGRNSWNNSGGILLNYVHTNLIELGYDNNNNAFWDGSKMVYGDGDGINFQPLTSVDVVGHEIGHGVCESSANLTYSKEQGALNEGFSDIWGASIEASSSTNKQTWLMGEDITNGGFRSLSNPKFFGQPDTYEGVNWINPVGCTPGRNNDYCGVHTNSGVLNYWYYLLSVGGSGTNDINTAYSVSGITINKAAQIAYRAESQYLVSYSDFASARTSTSVSAKDLYGLCSTERISTENAWNAVGIGNAPLLSNSTLRGTYSFCGNLPYQFSTTSSSSVGLSVSNSCNSIFINLANHGIATTYTWTINSQSGNVNTYFSGTQASLNLVSGGSSVTVTCTVQDQCSGITRSMTFNCYNYSSSSFAVYPNPSNTNITVTVVKPDSNSSRTSNEFSETEINLDIPDIETKIVDKNGITIIDGKLVNGKATFNTQNIVDGIYFLHIGSGTENDVIKKQILIQH